MPRSDFIEQLKKLGYEEGLESKGDFVLFDYVIEIGGLKGKKIKIAFQVGDDFPLNPPGGPHLSPQLLPIHAEKDLPHPKGAVHNSPLGEGWEYWSRPFQNWSQSDQNVKVYMAFIRRLFEDL